MSRRWAGVAILGLAFVIGCGSDQRAQLITDTNARTIEGNRVTWTFGPEAFLFSDYRMEVTARIVNWWLVTAAGCTLLLLVFLFFIAPLS